jgi:polyphenol oxidase
VTFDVFTDCPVRTFFSNKTHGDMKNSEQNRLEFVKALGLNPKLLFGAEQQVHGKEVFWVTKDNLETKIECDAFITKEPGIIVSVRVADCLPVYVYDPEKKAVAMIHAGWKGLAQNIIKEAVIQLGKPENIRAAVGPCIQSCHFEVTGELARVFAKYPQAIESRDNKIFIDLPKIAQTQLLSLGLKAENIELSNKCTYDSEDLFSHRQNKGKETETMLAGIQLNYTSSS